MRWTLPLALLLLSALAGCAAHPGPATPTTTITSTTAAQAHCTPARGISQGIELVNGTYAAPDGSVWRETNGLAHLQEIKTCEGPADTRVAPPGRAN